MTRRVGWILLIAVVFPPPSCTHARTRAVDERGEWGGRPPLTPPTAEQADSAWAGAYVLTRIGEDTLPARPGSEALAGTYRSGLLFLHQGGGFDLILDYQMDTGAGGDGSLTLSGSVFAPEGTSDLLLIVRGGMLRSGAARFLPRFGTLLVDLGEDQVTVWVGRHAFLFRKSSSGDPVQTPELRRFP